MFIPAFKQISLRQQLMFLQNGSDYDCGSALVTWLGDGTLHPVWSGHRIYKNMECARCHGVKEKDVTFWNTTVYCHVTDVNGLKKANANAMYLFRDHFSESRCRLFYTINADGVKRFKCMDQIADSCR